MLGAEFWILAQGQRKMGQKAGPAGLATKNLDFELFH